MSEQPKIEDGGPAFPVNDSTISGEPGMTLRDYFAAKAICSLILDVERESETFASSDLIANTARQAYAYADAMLQARKQENP